MKLDPVDPGEFRRLCELCNARLGEAGYQDEVDIFFLLKDECDPGLLTPVFVRMLMLVGLLQQKPKGLKAFKGKRGKTKGRSYVEIDNRLFYAAAICPIPGGGGRWELADLIQVIEREDWKDA